jgi:hypothetical protein
MLDPDPDKMNADPQPWFTPLYKALYLKGLSREMDLAFDDMHGQF